MRFAILGDHPDGWCMARALIASGRHTIVAYHGATPIVKLVADLPALRVTTDLEEVLADPKIEAVIVAGRLGERLDQLRRVLQSERPALCVHPVDRKTDGAYEINMLQGDVHQIVLPLLPEPNDPSFKAFRQGLLERQPRIIELTVTGPKDFLFDGPDAEARPNFPGWTLLRRLGGEIVEIAGFAVTEEVRAGDTVLLQGRFENGTLLCARYSPHQNDSPVQMQIVVNTDQPNPEQLVLGDKWANVDIWQPLVNEFEEAVEQLKVSPRAVPGSGLALAKPGILSWQDEIRALELDDSMRRSIERRRAYTMEFQESSEDVGFKGTMTLVGCGLLWFIPVLLVIAAWIPQVGWLIVPVLLTFLGLQLLRWFVPASPHETRS